MSRPLLWAAALLVVYALISVLPTAEAGIFSRTAQEPAFAIVPPRVSSKGRGEATGCPTAFLQCLLVCLAHFNVIP